MLVGLFIGVNRLFTCPPDVRATRPPCACACPVALLLKWERERERERVREEECECESARVRESTVCLLQTLNWNILKPFINHDWTNLRCSSTVANPSARIVTVLPRVSLPSPFIAGRVTVTISVPNVEEEGEEEGDTQTDVSNIVIY